MADRCPCGRVCESPRLCAALGACRALRRQEAAGLRAAIAAEPRDDLIPFRRPDAEPRPD